jgi:peptidyl-prolyl cis-trans isomerase B (cyclophilin B)
MAVRGAPYVRAVLFLGLAGVVCGAGSLGCQRLLGKKPKKRADPAAAAATAKDDESAKKVPAVTVEPRFRQPFAEATRRDALEGWNPPATTATGKSVGALYDQVHKSWDGIRFVSDEGKRIVYHAVLDTEEGVIDIELRPDWAPNHVRNFVALARAGYYDGLEFDRIVNQASKKSNDKVELIEGGGPLGLADDQDGIGYWLKDEFNPKLAHEEGVVGAAHGEEADSAACKFYVMLCKAPRLDGNYTLFGRVAQGLDVARKIEQQPVQKNDENTGAEEEDVVGGDYHMLKPVVIKKVTIQTREVDKPGPGGDN